MSPSMSFLMGCPSSGTLSVRCSCNGQWHHERGIL